MQRREAEKIQSKRARDSPNLPRRGVPVALVLGGIGKGEGVGHFGEPAHTHTRPVTTAVLGTLQPVASSTREGRKTFTLARISVALTSS